MTNEQHFLVGCTEMEFFPKFLNSRGIVKFASFVTFDFVPGIFPLNASRYGNLTVVSRFSANFPTPIPKFLSNGKRLIPRKFPLKTVNFRKANYSTENSGN